MLPQREEAVSPGADNRDLEAVEERSPGTVEEVLLSGVLIEEICLLAGARACISGTETHEPMMKTKISPPFNSDSLKMQQISIIVDDNYKNNALLHKPFLFTT
jgi:hypothetical protein